MGHDQAHRTLLARAESPSLGAWFLRLGFVTLVPLAFPARVPINKFLDGLNVSVVLQQILDDLPADSNGLCLVRLVVVDCRERPKEVVSCNHAGGDNLLGG